MSYIYKYQLGEYNKRLKDMTDERVIYVTDLVACPLKRRYRIRYPLLAFSLEPRSIIGEFIHKGIQSIFETSPSDAGVTWRSEVEISTKINIDGETYLVKGRADLVGYEERNGEARPRYIVEIKSLRKITETPLEHHVKQLLIYLKLFGADKGILFYVSFDKIVEYEYTSKDAESVDIVELVRATISADRVPRYEWECKYCPFRKICPYSRL